MNEETRIEYQQYLIKKYGIKLRKQIFDDESDYSHKEYQMVFKDFDWEENNVQIQSNN